MKKSVYKIINTINNKVYVGISNNPHKRFGDHCKPSSNKYPIDIAINKYGKENFIMEILENSIEDYNQKERFYITLFKSNISEYGYNLTEGGENAPTNFKVNSEQLERAFKLLINSRKTISELAIELDITEKTLININNGTYYKNDDLTYPIRETYCNGLDHIAVKEIKDKLLNTKITISDLANMYNVEPNTISAINSGSRHFDTISDYPIRKTVIKNPTKISEDSLHNIINDLKNNERTIKEIAIEYNSNERYIRSINLGQRRRQNNEEYPLRETQRTKKNM